MEPSLNFNSFIGKRFQGHKIQKLASMIDYLKHGQIIPRGTLVIMASGSTHLQLKILEKDTPHKGFSMPLPIRDSALAKGITPNYLHWFLSQSEISSELMQHARGSVFLRIPKIIIDQIPVPIPRKIQDWPSQANLILKKDTDEFKSLIAMFYEDFQLNVKHKRYRTAVILAGAICETMLFQLLIECGVEKNLLEEDKLALGGLIKYVKLLKLDKELGIPLNHIQEIQKSRNKAVHIGASKLTNYVFSHNDVKAFDHIIKYFGI